MNAPDLRESDSRVLGDPGTAAFQVHKYPFFQLNRLVSRYNAVIGARLRAIGLDIPGWRVLMILGERTPRTTSELADEAVIPLSTMTRIVQRMAADGLISTAESSGDKRVTEVTLEAHGEGKLAEARQATSPIYGQVIRGLSGRDFDKLLVLLETLHDNLADSEEGPRR